MKENQKFHFVGIGGAGMSGIARVLLDMGYEITGSDLKESRNTIHLKKHGARIIIGHHPSNVDSADIVVVSSAIPGSNCEIRSAREKSIPVLARAEMLVRLAEGKTTIAIAGTHGKTTTTSMVSFLFEQCEVDPTFLIGGELNDIGSNARYGKGDYFIAETDESDGSLLFMRPDIIILTNIEADHLDHYGDFSRIEKTFERFTQQMSPNGLAIVCGDHVNVIKIIRAANKEFKTYGLSDKCDFFATHVNFSNFGSSFKVFHSQEELGEVRLQVPGLHNIYNALAAITLGISLGLPFERVSSALKEFGGVRRRFQLMGSYDGITLVDDYAHHPTEIKVTLEAAKVGDWKRVICVFQPHRYTRTKFLHTEFGASFNNSDITILTDIYGAGEGPLPGVTGKLLVDSVLEKNPGKQVIYLPKKNDIKRFLLSCVRPGDLVLIMGAGDIWTVGEEFLDGLKQRAEAII